MISRIQKEYEAFKSIITNPHYRNDTSKLNIIYTMVCNAKKDAKYKAELESFIVPDGTGMNFLEAIDTFFREFNNSHGVDIRLSLSPFENPDFPRGLYFIVKTYKEGKNGIAECSPIEYKIGEKAIFRATVYDQVTDEEVVVPLVKYYIYSEDGTEERGEKENSSFIEFSATCHRPGAVRAEVTACDKNGMPISGSEKAVPGAVFDFTEMKTSLPTPDDLGAFWQSEVERMKKVNPTDTSVTPYNGRVAHAFNVTETNYYHIKKADRDYMAILRSKKLTNVPDEVLDNYDLWEFSLKCPGPCPATGYVSVPKDKEPHSLPIKFIYAGYSAHSPQPFFLKNSIAVYSTHHGYPCALSDEECYNELNGKGILGSYGKGNGKPNSDFDDIHDGYTLYLNLRNLQVLRFFANADLSSDIPEVFKVWNGDVNFDGGSLGGYQVIAMSALVNFLDEEINVTQGKAEVPGFCNYAGVNDKRLPNTFDLHHSKNAEYFDAAHLATLVTAPMLIPRNAFGDELCVCSGICMAFNNFKGKKEINFLQNSSHGYRPKPETQLWYKYSNTDNVFQNKLLTNLE
ncbi:MAG: acetylxylan esterase [Ruminococcaceae bacterium]|nr:acetylxylan esterase [Oscillospiraceae bacterium]